MSSRQANGSSGNSSSWDRNTSLWITGLQHDVSYSDLCCGMKNTGKIRHIHITRPDQKHANTRAARVVFFRHDAARKVIDRAREGTFVVQNIRPTVVWNRRYTEEMSPWGRSRVLRIEGPLEIVNQNFLESFWGREFYWGTEWVEIIVQCPYRGCGKLLYSFASWEAQAERAGNMLRDAFGDRVYVSYDRDWCEDSYYWS
ncbi:hypothetical protein F5Y10DRAFT_267926 [Nemania abortiva]|nr:hypothetical protein F5Y10DRAFT_267926 [Nemania abortiva]